MIWWICGHTKRDQVRNDDIRERLGVAPVDEKLMQHRLRWFGHIQRRPVKTSIRNGLIRRTDNEKRDRGRPNLMWEESVKRDLKDWCITKKLTLDRREYKLAIHVSESWSLVHSFYCLVVKSFFRPFSLFWLSVLLSFLLFLIYFFIAFCFPHSFSLLFCSCFLAHVVSSLTYPTCLWIKDLVVVMFLYMWYGPIISDVY
jgi:hypothetical protein